MSQMAMDSYSQALQSRRGKSLDGALMHAGESDHGGRGDTEQTPFGGPKTTHMDEHTAPVREGESFAPPASRLATEHQDEHTPVVHQDTPYANEDAQAEAEIREHIIGHVSPGERESLSGMKPRSLGERVKMAAMEKNK